MLVKADFFVLPTWRRFTGPPKTLILDCTAAAATEQNKAKKPGKLTPSQAAVRQQHQRHHRLHKGRTHQAQGHLCQWSLGNSPMQLLQSLEKQHTERHLEQVALYLQHYSGFSSAAKTGMITTAPASNLLPMDKLTSYQWLLAVYIQDT
ncbi:uncharacterized protein LOC143293388 [Babylonia areolata]|uniref:uncharacterized protein LOC143293388 n=1 Tax=Babylonia areolata TaxID=304850 RepID=UPI003FD1DE21